MTIAEYMVEHEITATELANRVGIHKATVCNWFMGRVSLNRHKDKFKALGINDSFAVTKERKLPKKIYTLYKGEKQLFTGTLEEIAEFRGIKMTSVYHLNSPAYRKRGRKIALEYIGMKVVE